MNTLEALYIGYYFVTDIDGTPQGIDKDSGGYNYCASSPSDIKYWKRLDEAQKYLDICNWKHRQDPKQPRELFLCQITGISGIKL